MLMLASFCEGIAEQEPAALLLIVNRWNMIGFVFSSTYHVHQYTNILAILFVTIIVITFIIIGVTFFVIIIVIRFMILIFLVVRFE